MPELVPLTPHVLVATAERYLTTTTVVLDGAGGCLLVDPAITPADLTALATELHDRGLRVTAGFSTHPHWDHLLWSARFGAAPRFATAAAAGFAAQARRQLWEQAPLGHDAGLFARLVPLPDAGSLPWRGPRVDVVAHRAHATGHAALHVVGEQVLIAGDMCSDVEVPLLDLDATDPLGDYHHALDLFDALAAGVRHVVPGHGHAGDGAELRRRLAADRRYLDELRTGRGDDDPRLTAGWLIDDHRAQRARVAAPLSPRTG